MKIGNLVTFNRLTTKNTPGVPSCVPSGIGTVINDSYESGIMFQGDLWCDILWPSGELTKCYKKDLGIVES